MRSSGPAFQIAVALAPFLLRGLLDSLQQEARPHEPRLPAEGDLPAHVLLPVKLVSRFG